MDPMSSGASADPMGSMGDGPRSGAPKVFVILLAILVVLLFVGLGALVFTLSGDDGGGDEEGSVEASSSEPAEEDDAEDPEEDAEDPGDEDDADGDGLPDNEDTDDDGDGQPDTEDPDDDGDGVPDDEETDDGEDGDDGDDTEDPDDGDDGDDGDETDEPDTELNLLTNSPRPAVDAWIDVVGGNAKAIEVLLYPTYAFLQVRDPDKPQQVLDFGWRDGVTEGPEPADVFPGTDLDAESFRMNAVNWDALPGLVANAPERAHLPQGEVTHVIVTSDLPFSPRFIFRIYVTAPNGSDYVVATIDGQPAQR